MRRKQQDGTAVTVQVAPSRFAGPWADRLVKWAQSRPADAAYTFVDYQQDPDGVPQTITWAQLHCRAAALAVRLGRVMAPGERVAVLAPSGLDYVVGLFAAWHARAIAVPMFLPTRTSQVQRLAASFDDCAPACVLTVSAEGDAVVDFMRGRPTPAEVLAIDERDNAAGHANWRPVPAKGEDVAYLQYTSGSTRSPAGVEISYSNMGANVGQLWTALAEERTGIVGVNWLPLYHDMGLLATVAMPLLWGTEAVLFDPTAFLMRPVRWLRLLSGRSNTYTAAPNFAYEYCLRRIGPADRAGLDLSGVVVWLNGAEPVKASTIHRFAAEFRDVGVSSRTICAAYGLAEATVFVAADRPNCEPTATSFDRDRLANGEAVLAEGDTIPSILVSCGVEADQQVVIVDPKSAAALPSGRVGEIWVSGSNVARGYWRQSAHTEHVFGAMLRAAPPHLRTGPWLRTGDLGMFYEGQLYVTGRLKDLLIVAGRNHYPQDIEQTVAQACPTLQKGRTVAFSISMEGEERIVVVAERSRSAKSDESEAAAVTQTVRQAVWMFHELSLHDVVLTQLGTVPRTSSGKVSRTACRKLYLDGGFSR